MLLMKKYGLKTIKTPSEKPLIQFQLVNIVQHTPEHSPNLV